MKKLLFIFFIFNILVPNTVANNTILLNIEQQTKHLSIVNKAEYLNILASKYLNKSVDSCYIYVTYSLTFATKHNLFNQQLDALNTLAKLYKIKGNNTLAIATFNKVVTLSLKINQLKYTSQAYNNIGILNANMGNTNSALLYYNKALKLKKQLSDSIGIAISLNNMANVYFKTGNYTNALLYYQQALPIFEALNHYNGISGSLNGCGLVLENLGNYSNALNYYNAALQIAKKQHNKVQIANFLNNIGNIQSKLKNYPKALLLYKQALNIRISINDSSAIAGSLNNIGIFYKVNNNPLLAIEYFKKALKINYQIHNSPEIALNLNAIGSCYLILSNYKLALSYINKSYNLSQLTNNILLEKNNLNSLSEIYLKLKNFEQALKYYQQSITVNNKLESVEVKNKIIELETRYQTEKKEQSIRIIQKQNEIQKLQLNRVKLYTIGLIVVIFLMLLTGKLIIKQNKLNAQRKSLIIEQKLLRTQMNPHFIFNALTSIQSFIFSDDKLQAGKYISDFASLMRLILENSREEFITLEKEVATLKHYLELQKLRHENLFNYTITVDNTLNTDMPCIPPMLGQPFVENAIKHGFINKSNGKIDVRFYKKQNLLCFEIEDNGIGRKKAMQMKQNKEDNHKSLATSITSERLNNLNQGNRNKITFEIIDVENINQTGTLIKFEIPV